MDQDTEYLEVNHSTGANNAMPRNPPGPIPTNNNNKSKVDTVDDESNNEEDETENKETIQDEEGFEFQLKSHFPAKRHAWEASRRHGLCPCRQPRFEKKNPSDHYTSLTVHVFTQLNLKQGLKRFGTEGIKATKSEMQQMHDKLVFHTIKY